MMRAPMRPARAHSRVRRATQGCSPRAPRSARTASRKPRPCCDATCTSTRPTSPPSACSPKLLRIGRYHDAENLLARCLELAPGFHGARHNYTVALMRQGKYEAALPQIERLLAAEPRNPNYRTLQAAVLAGIGEYVRAIEVYVAVLREYPRQGRIWMSYGHALKTAGRVPEGIEAYHQALRLEPRLGEAWWSLANLKTYRFGADHIARMRAQLAGDDLSAEDRFHFHFALGKALEDQGEYEQSFRHYREGNVLRRSGVHYEPERIRQ